MNIWHLTADTPRTPHRGSGGDVVSVDVGTWPVEPGQEVWLVVRVEHASAGTPDEARVPATWVRNEGENSYWRAELGPFADADLIRYAVMGRGPAGDVSGPRAEFRVGPRLRLALLWHQHQPQYRDLDSPSPRGSYQMPWVRLHAIRDYYSMAALVAEHPDLHLTINLSPVLLRQIEDYAERGATDRALDLTLTPAERLTSAETAELLSTFFNAHWHNQIFPYARYKELFEQRMTDQLFDAQDLRDLQMWFNLAWFGKEFRDGAVTLATGTVASVHRFVDQARGFSMRDVEEMVAEQLGIMRAVIPIHRALQDRGQIEVSTTPLTHPILPLLMDTDRATIDRPGATHPTRFAHPEDADEQVRLAAESYERWFGRRPRGMWPAEGAVSQSVVPIFAHHGVQWIASDRGVLARSGRWGYDVSNPDVTCQPYRAEEGAHAVSVFFRDTWLADHIGFHYQRYASYEDAARAFLTEAKERFARRVIGGSGSLSDDDRILTVVLDGENAWGEYREDARPFLHALYTVLERDGEVQTVTFSEYLEGNAGRHLRAHPTCAQQRVHDLFTGSWIDEAGSAPGVDLGTWIGESEENRAWALLGRTRDDLTRAESDAGMPDEAVARAYDALYAAEGSDWFWWYGDDQESGSDDRMDDLFRRHLRSVYVALGLTAPRHLDDALVPRNVIWAFAQPVPRVRARDRLTVQTHCPGVISWRTADDVERNVATTPTGGVLAGAQQYRVTLGPFQASAGRLRFRFRCTQPACDGAAVCCRGTEQVVELTSDVGERLV